MTTLLSRYNYNKQNKNSGKKMITRFAVLLMTALIPTVCATQLKGLYFEHKDWEIACDNTGTCRAAGYTEDEVSVLLTREAGADQLVSGEVTFAKTETETPSNLQAKLYIDDAFQGTLSPSINSDFMLESAQVSQLLMALNQDKKIEFVLNSQRHTLSTAGSNAVLLKMDEFQHRLGTKNALIRPGSLDETQVLPAYAVPEIIKPPTLSDEAEQPLTPAQYKHLFAQLSIEIEKECSAWQNDSISEEVKKLTLIPVDKQHSLIKTVCWRGAYNEGYAMWLVDNALKSKPSAVTYNASDYFDGTILSSHKGRGLGDCYSLKSWVWNGKQFALNADYTTGKCRGIAAGGAWYLPAFVSNVYAQQDLDKYDAALKTLHKAVEEVQKSDPEIFLDKALEHFPIKKSLTSFYVHYVKQTEDNGLFYTLPKEKPSGDISDDEWQALLNSDVVEDSENFGANYSLVDLDNDGKRDLIIDSYLGGTGLFSYVRVLKRGTDNFYQPTDAFNPYQHLPRTIYSINGRGSYQWDKWIEINGQVYAVWFNGRFGEDKLYLLPPFSPLTKFPTLAIQYHYDLALEAPPKDEPLTSTNRKLYSDIKDRSDLSTQIHRLQSHWLKQRNTTSASENEPVCPIPPGTPKEETGNYFSGPPLHYTVETIADFPVWLNNICFIGRLSSHFGYYDQNKGVSGSVVIISPRKGEEELEAWFDFSGKRKVISITPSWSEREGDHGAY